MSKNTVQNKPEALLIRKAQQGSPLSLYTLITGGYVRLFHSAYPFTNRKRAKKSLMTRLFPNLQVKTIILKKALQ